MSRFIDNEATVAVHAPWWDEDETVFVKRAMSFADQRAITEATVRVVGRQVAGADGPTAEYETSIGAGLRETLCRLIVSWTFQVGEGERRRPMPLTPEAIDLLADEDAQYIKTEIDRLNAPRGKADDKSFDGASAERLRVMDRPRRASS